MLFQTVKGQPPSWFRIAIDTEQKQVHLPLIVADYFLQELNFQSLADPTDQRVFQHLDDGWLLQFCEHGRDDWMQNELVFAKVFGNHQNVHRPPSSPSIGNALGIPSLNSIVFSIHELSCN